MTSIRENDDLEWGKAKLGLPHTAIARIIYPIYDNSFIAADVIP